MSIARIMVHSGNARVFFARRWRRFSVARARVRRVSWIACEVVGGGMVCCGFG